LNVRAYKQHGVLSIDEQDNAVKIKRRKQGFTLSADERLMQQLIVGW
jgi:hypothetical protein